MEDHSRARRSLLGALGGSLSEAGHLARDRVALVGLESVRDERFAGEAVEGRHC